jgi:hypothetical protein
MPLQFEDPFYNLRYNEAANYYLWGSTQCCPPLSFCYVIVAVQNIGFDIQFFKRQSYRPNLSENQAIVRMQTQRHDSFHTNMMPNDALVGK